MAPQAKIEVQKVMQVVKDFDQYSSSLAEEQVRDSIRSQLQTAQEAAAEKQAAVQGQVDELKNLLEQAEVSSQEALQAEQAAAAEVQAKGELLATAQVDAASARKEYDEAQLNGEEELQKGQELRQAKADAAEVAERLQKLHDGAYASEEELADTGRAVQDYLQACGAEKALVATLPNAFLIKPADRGFFDQVTIDSISEVSSQKLQATEEELEQRAPTEKEAKAEILGLWALHDVNKDKEKKAADVYAAAEAALATAKASTRAQKKEVTKHRKSLDSLVAEQDVEVEKVQEAREAFDRLCTEAIAAAEAAAAEAARAAAEAEAKAEAEANKRAAEEAAEAEPEAKRPRTEGQDEVAVAVEEPKVVEETRKEDCEMADQAAKVASPARARLNADITAEA